MGSSERLARFTIERRVNHIVCCASSPVLCHNYVNAQVPTSVNVAWWSLREASADTYISSNNRTAESLLVCTTVESIGTTAEGISAVCGGCY